MEKKPKKESNVKVIHLTPDNIPDEVKVAIEEEHNRFQSNAEELYRSIAERNLGFPGKMISGSKSGYTSRYPKHDVIFNANIFTEAGKKIWYGDLDITNSGPNLQTLSKELGEKIFVLYEWDGRFDFETNPRLDQAPWTCEPDGTVVNKFND